MKFNGLFPATKIRRTQRTCNFFEPPPDILLERMGVVGNGGRLKDPDIFLDERLDHVPIRLYDKKICIRSDKLRTFLPGINGLFKDPLNRICNSRERSNQGRKFSVALLLLGKTFLLWNFHVYVNVPKQTIQR